jgi:hypothetical protein
MVANDGEIVAGHGRLTVENPDGAGFSAYLPDGKFTILLRKADRRLGKDFKRWLWVRRQVFSIVINPGPADAGGAIAAACDACRTPGRDVPSRARSSGGWASGGGPCCSSAMTSARAPRQRSEPMRSRPRAVRPWQ